MRETIILAFCVFFASSVRQTVYQTENVPASELNALQSLYNATGGNNWKWEIKNGSGNVWDFSVSDANPCADDWQGVTCTGTVSGEYRHVIELDLSAHRMHGTLPDAIGNLTLLQSLTLSENVLFGPIPTNAWPLLSNLSKLDLHRNSFTGTIPPTIGELKKLTLLELNSNWLNGSIDGPTGAALCSLSNLHVLALYNNLLTGTIPACVGSMTQLWDLELGVNFFNGTLPESLGNLVYLRQLDLDTNRFSGTIPSTLCAFEIIEGLFLDYNRLTGSIPNCLGNLSRLQHIGLSYNHLTGTIPPSLGLLPDMSTMYFDSNHLNGTLPDFGTQLALTQITAGHNRLTGTVPDCFAALVGLQTLNFSDNFLTGTIPDSISNLHALEILSFGTNQLTGSIPAFVSTLSRVGQMYFDNNNFGGSLDGVFNASMQQKLVDIFFYNNHLTGPLPAEMFRLPRLNTIVGQSNCFTGTLPATMCDSPAVSLILDGLHTSPTCRRVLLSSKHSFGTARGVHGTIPACLLSMPTLVSLHLSGNDLTGTLAGHVVVADQLVDLVVSHNSLTGSIPASIQEHAWNTLDLSYNRLDGELLPSFGSALSTTEVVQVGNITFNFTSPSVSLQNNRISGNIPSSVVNVPGALILGSNMFSCKFDKSDLPNSDKSRQQYQCGSDAFNGPFYIVLILAGVVLALLLGAKYELQVLRGVLMKAIEHVRWLVSQLTALPADLLYALSMSDRLCTLGALCAVVVVVVLVPWYAAASQYYGTYAHQYAWVVSAGFTSGLPPAATGLALYCAFLAALVLGLDSNVLLPTSTEVTSTVAADAADSSAPDVPAWKRALAFLMFLTINFAVVVGVNVGFVAIALTQNNARLVVAQVVLSGFKLVWNTVCTPYMISIVVEYTSHAHQRLSRRMLSFLQAFIGLFNNIAIPCLVVAAQSPSCYNDLFKSAPEVSSTYFVPSCADEPNFQTCSYRNPRFFTSTFHAPFRYDYQCSASFVTYYAPAFVYLGLAASVGAPALVVLTVRLLQRFKLPPRARHMLILTVPRLLAQSLGLTEASPGGVLCARSPLKYADLSSYFISLITYLGILLTFGVVFPPLAVVMCATMLSVSWQAKLSLAKFVASARAENKPQVIDAIATECRGVVSPAWLQTNIFLIVCYSCCFYALFLFDTLGDQEGQSGAIWVLLAMALFPVPLYGFLRAGRSFLWGDRAAAAAGAGRGVFEMKRMEAPNTESSACSPKSVTTGADEDKNGDVVFNALTPP